MSPDFVLELPQQEADDSSTGVIPYFFQSGTHGCLPEEVRTSVWQCGSGCLEPEGWPSLQGKTLFWSKGSAPISGGPNMGFFWQGRSDPFASSANTYCLLFFSMSDHNAHSWPNTPLYALNALCSILSFGCEKTLQWFILSFLLGLWWTKELEVGLRFGGFTYITTDHLS